MAIKKDRLIFFLEKTIDLLSSSSHYEWGHSGACNCGHLAQVITGYKKSDIHKWSLEKHGDWSDKAEHYCENSGYAIDNVIGIMLSEGLQIEDINHIEYLNHPKVLAKLRDGRKQLERNLKEDVIVYFQCWIQLLREEVETELADPSWISRHDENAGTVQIYDSVPEAI